MNHLIHGATIKPFGLPFSMAIPFEKLKAPLKFIGNLYKKSILNDFSNIFSAPCK